MNIVFLDRITVGDVSNLDLLKTHGNLITYDYTEKQDIKPRVKNAEIIITNKVIIDHEIIDSAPKLKLICIAATGINNVDLEYAESKNILVKNVSGYSTFSVTQSTFSMLLYLVNHNLYFDNYVDSGEYAKSPVFTHLGRTIFELKGKVFGIIGMGTIGKSVGTVAKSFGCEVIYYSTSGENRKQTSFSHCEFDELLHKADIISIHAPLNNKTYDLINFDALKKMKKSSILINTGRGGIVNEKDLAQALNNNLIAGAALDVLTEEPINPSNPLLSVNNKEKIFITPHIAWASYESRKLLIEKVAANINDYVKSINN